LNGQMRGKVGAAAGLAANRDVAAHHLTETAADRQPQAGPAVLARRRVVALAERLEQPVHLLGSDADATVADMEGNRVAPLPGLADHFHLDPSSLPGTARAA